MNTAQAPARISGRIAALALGALLTVMLGAAKCNIAGERPGDSIYCPKNADTKSGNCVSPNGPCRAEDEGKGGGWHNSYYICRKDPGSSGEYHWRKTELK